MAAFESNPCSGPSCAEDPARQAGVTEPMAPVPSPTGPDRDEDATGPLKRPPKELGVMLVSAGVIGFVLPGPGIPALVAGGLILWPEGFGKVEGWLRRRHPDMHRKGIGYLDRFLNDLERRYPGSTGSQ
jgi:hypothetical protein